MKSLSKVYLLIAGFFLVYFSYQAFITAPSEGDSLAYHLPIARNIIDNVWTDFEKVDASVNGLLQYYPASSHVILAFFVWLNIPQFFNVFGLVILGFISFHLGKSIGLKNESAVIAAISIVSLTSLIRLVLTQTIDIWLAVWFVAALDSLYTFRPATKMVLYAGVALGMLIGTKYTGPFFALLLLTIFRNKFLTKRFMNHSIYFVISIVVLGLFWYLRNFIAKGDLFYPASHPLFHLDEAYTWQTVFASPKSLGFFLQALVSEYGIWVFGLMTMPVIIFSKKINKTTKTFASIALLSFFIHLLLPASPDNTLSDLRYAAPTFIAAIFTLFLYVKERGRGFELALLGLMPLLAVFSLKVSHQPKIFYGYALVVLVLVWKKGQLKAKSTL